MSLKKILLTEPKTNLVATKVDTKFDFHFKKLEKVSKRPCLF